MWNRCPGHLSDFQNRGTPLRVLVPGVILLAEPLIGEPFSEEVDLAIDRQAQRPEPRLNPELEALLPF